MHLAGLLAAVALSALVAAYLGLSLIVFTTIVAVILCALTFLVGTTYFVLATLAVFLVLAAVLNVRLFRRFFITDHFLKLFRKLIPPISQTEREALEAGAVWWEKDLFSGRPDWTRLHSFRAPKLSDEEKAFLAGPAEKLCQMMDDWKITDKHHDLPKDVWDFLKKEKFFGLIIPKKYGGLEFSALAHSEVILKLSSRSLTSAVTVMVPNSLGPAELLLHYGTDEQKNRYLPGLANGSEIPCFALTEPQAGSDASSITSNGVVEKGVFNGKEIIGIRANWDKRYITLAPIATLVGLAIKLYDPNKLLGDKKDVGITVLLVPSNLPGVEVGARHDPLGIPFLNGPTRGKNVFMPLDYIVGGAPYAGKGWRMLMERLSIGRGISLPSLGTSAAKLAARSVGAYSRIRTQFHLPVCRFEGVEEALASIAGHAYAVDATRRLTVGAIDDGARPSLASAMAKYNVTERMRTVCNNAMDVQGGAAISLGPRNIMGRAYQGVPVSITVEGANILTRTLIIFGQGVIRAHPYVLREMEAAASKDPIKGPMEFDCLFFSHVGFAMSTAVRTFVSGLTCGVFLPSRPGSMASYYRSLGRMSSAFALVSDAAMMALGGKLKRMEKLAGRLADVISNLYIASAALKKFADDGSPEEDEPLVKWVCEDSLFRIQTALDGFLLNLPNRMVAASLRVVVFPYGKPFRPPGDGLGAMAARIITEPGAARDRLTSGIFLPKGTDDQMARIEDALLKVVKAEPAAKKVQEAVRDGKITALDQIEQAEEAARQGLITDDEKKAAVDAEMARRAVVAVDEFPADYWSKRDAGI